MLLFPLYSPILKPDFNLSLCHTQGMCNFNPSTARQVAIKMKFFLQFKSLVSSVGCPDSFLHTVLINVCVAMTFIEEYCMDQTGPLQHQGIQVRKGACPWPVGDDDADTRDLDEFDALALDRSRRTFDAPFSTSSSDFGTRP